MGASIIRVGDSTETLLSSSLQTKVEMWIVIGMPVRRVYLHPIFEVSPARRLWQPFGFWSQRRSSWYNYRWMCCRRIGWGVNFCQHLNKEKWKIIWLVRCNFPPSIINQQQAAKTTDRHSSVSGVWQFVAHHLTTLKERKLGESSKWNAKVIDAASRHLSLHCFAFRPWEARFSLQTEPAFQFAALIN